MATLTETSIGEGEQRMRLPGFIAWDQYIAISDALPDWAGLRMIYVDGRLTLLSPSRAHEWYAEIIDDLVKAVAAVCNIIWEDAGHATFRLEELGAGVEGDKTYYFGPHAEQMLGPQNIDLATQPPPDLALEIEVTHPADDTMLVYGRLRVPEVWRIDVRRGTVAFWVRREDGTYTPADRSLALPVLEPADVLAQLRLAEQLGASRWHAQLDGWVRGVLLPRRGGGG